MNVLVIGSGGREHALCWGLSRSADCGNLYCAPGNGGISQIAECVAIDLKDHGAVADFCKLNAIGLVVIGPEDPLANGLADDLRAADIATFGPSAAAAQLEASKGFMKDLCAANNIPTARYARFTNQADAESYIRDSGAPIVVKADGLAAGKGVTVAETIDDAIEAVGDSFSGQFGEAGAEVVIEECMVGEEASFFVLTDGKTALPLATAQDHKRAFDGDEGPNTGGMGAYSPAPVMTPELVEQTMARIIEPTIKAMSAAGTPYTGVLYAGLMITDEGPKLIEYNVRFGDPECQVLVVRLKSDLLPLLHATATGTLQTNDTQWHEDAAMTVVMAAKGYPGSYDKGSVIGGLDGGNDNVVVFHAGTAKRNGDMIATGGRVLNVTARGKTVGEARDKVYAKINEIDWPEGFYRSDIGWRAIRRETK